jgi:arsenite methyltransferase
MPPYAGSFDEHGPLIESSSEPLRPGGLKLTEKGLSFCELPPGSKILDAGCGRGTSLFYLKEAGFDVYGLDVSARLLRDCSPGNIPLVRGVAEAIPLAARQMDAVLAECTLSLMADLPQALAEIQRLLIDEGWLVFSDVYARSESGLADLRRMESFDCLKHPCSGWGGPLGFTTQSEIKEILAGAGFKICFWEDHSQDLRRFATRLIQRYGSLPDFSNPAMMMPGSPGMIPGSPSRLDALDTQLLISKVKAGYFLAVARKV